MGRISNAIKKRYAMLIISFVNPPLIKYVKNIAKQKVF